MLTYFTTNTIAELTCFICALVFLHNDKNMVWRCMIIFLLITCVIEFSGLHIKLLYKQKLIKTGNNWLYNIFLIPEACFTSFMFAQLFGSYPKGKPIIITGIALFLTLYLYECFYHGFLIYNSNAYTLLSVQFAIYSLLYYYLLIKSDHHIELTTSPAFWWVAGTLFFYFGNTVCNIFDKQLEDVMITPHLYLTSFIFKVLNVILYSCWSYSFICRKWQAKHQN